jgi:hypothetical protein
MNTHTQSPDTSRYYARNPWDGKITPFDTLEEAKAFDNGTPYRRGHVYNRDTRQAVLGRYSYRDTWNGNQVYFDTMKEAVESAKHEYGVSVGIHDAENNTIVTMSASGHVPV